MKLLSLSNSSRRTAIDDEDYERCKLYKWRLDTHGNHSQTVNGGPGNLTPIANYIMNDFKNTYDHRDLNPCNNQKSNLRICTNSQNGANKDKPNIPTSSKYKGVRFYKRTGRWSAQIQVNQKNIHLGYFDTEVKAARKYNIAAKQYFGEFARLNVIE
jgi:hypothetical protein